jgi:hypothetical protein
MAFCVPHEICLNCLWHTGSGIISYGCHLPNMASHKIIFWVGLKEMQHVCHIKLATWLSYWMKDNTSILFYFLFLTKILNSISLKKKPYIFHKLKFSVIYVCITYSCIHILIMNYAAANCSHTKRIICQNIKLHDKLDDRSKIMKDQIAYCIENNEGTKHSLFPCCYSAPNIIIIWTSNDYVWFKQIK